MLEIPDPIPGRKPIQRPTKKAKRIVLMLEKISLKLTPRPFMFSTEHSGIFVLPFALSRIIWHMANIPSICATVEIPP